MPIQDFGMDAAGRSISVFWDGEQWKELTVLVDGTIAGTIPHPEGLISGQEITRPDGTVLKVQTVNNDLHVWSNGQLLSAGRITRQAPAQSRASSQFAAPSKAVTRVRIAAGVTFLIGMVNIVLGVLNLQSASQYYYSASTVQGLSIAILALGGLFLLLGFFVARRSKTALGIAVGLYVVDALFALFTLNLLSLGVHLVLLLLMGRGFRGIQEIREAQELFQLGLSHHIPQLD